MGYFNLDIMLGSLCSIKQNEHCSGRGAGGLVLPVLGRKGKGARNGGSPVPEQIAEVGRGWGVSTYVSGWLVVIAAI